jgi:hypothetical protein
MVFKKIKSRKKRLAIYIFLVIVALFLIGMAYFFYELTILPSTPESLVTKIERTESESLLFYKTYVRIPTRAIVIPMNKTNQTLKLGIDTDTNELNWGKIPEGIKVVKLLDLKNPKKLDGKVNIFVYGDIKPYIVVDSKFILKSRETRNMELSFKSDKVGAYSGEIDVLVRVPKYDFILPFLDTA